MINRLILITFQAVNFLFITLLLHALAAINAAKRPTSETVVCKKQKNTVFAVADGHRLAQHVLLPLPQ